MCRFKVFIKTLNFVTYKHVVTHIYDCVQCQEYHVGTCIYFSKPERRGSDTSLKSTSSEKLCASLYENNANYSNDSICSNLSRSSDGMEWYPMANTDMETFRGQDVEGAFDIIVYIGEY